MESGAIEIATVPSPLVFGGRLLSAVRCPSTEGQVADAAITDSGRRRARSNEERSSLFAVGPKAAAQLPLPRIARHIAVLAARPSQSKKHKVEQI